MNLLDLMVRIGVQDEASGKVGGIASNITGGLGKAVAGVAKIGAAATAAAAGAAVTIGTAAVNSYAEQEQLWGGVQKLYGAAGMSLEEYAQSVGQSVDEAKGKYDELRQAEGLVAQNAQQAFKTAGMSSNEYMETATQFSASLINSLSGDTVEAARQTDVAMRAISDNVNTFGSDMGSVSDAFKGFSKQNYTMLDNLKLGYGGTKEEMERLIADANEWGAANGKASDLSIDSFSDVVTAIEQIQEKQGIAGTTAREAATTIEGSINMTKAAWQNLLTEFGKEDGDIPARMEELVDSAVTVLIGATDENGEKLSTGILGRVSTIVSNLSEAIPTMMPTIQAALSQAIPQVLQIITDTIPILLQLVGTVFTTLGTLLPTLFQTILPVVMEQILMLINTLTENMPAMFEAAGQLFGMITQAIATYGPQILAALGTLLVTLIFTLIDNIPNMLSAAGQLFMAIVTAIGEALPQIIEGLTDGLITLIEKLLEYMPMMLEAGGSFFLALAQAIVENLPEIVSALVDALGQLVGYVIEHGPEMLEAGLELVGNLAVAIAEALPDVLGAIGELAMGAVGHVGDFVGDMLQAGADLVQGLINGIRGAIGRVADALIGGLQRAVNAALSFLGIASPSKLFDWVGQMSMEGLAGGIEDTAAKAEKATEKAVQAIAGEMQSGMTFGDIEGPTIRTTYRTAERQPTMTDAERQIITALHELRQAIPTGVYLDSDSLVGQLAPDMSRAIVGV